MSIFTYIYTRPIIYIVLFMLAALIVWGYCQSLPRRIWGRLNVVLFVIAVMTVLYATLLNRSEGEFALVLRPFASLAEAKRQPELYRAMLMNVLLFFPIGLTLSASLPKKMSIAAKMAITTAVGFALSLAIEYAQYSYAMGRAEADDVICNTLGALLGSIRKKERTAPGMPTLTAEEKDFLNIVKASVSGGEIETKACDIAAVIELAGEQKLLPIVFESLRKSPAAEENAELFRSVRQQVIAQVMHQTQRSAEFETLYRELIAEGLHPIVVKGRMCAELYELCDHRISGDDDLLISDSERSACHAELTRRGLESDTPIGMLGSADEVGYTKKGSPIYIELHRRLFDSSETAHDDLNRFFTDVSPVERDGFLTLPPHEHFLYLILHAYKHFVRSGIGLRQFCDIGLWAKAYYDEIDWKLLYEQCESVHAATFAAAAFSVARDTLGIAFAPPEPWAENRDTEPLLHDTLCAGIYGSKDSTRLHSSTVTLGAVRSSRGSAGGGALASAFPNRSYMERSYPYLIKHPALLPFAWVQRILRYAREKDGGTSGAAASVKLAKERIELLKKYEII